MKNYKSTTIGLIFATSMLTGIASGELAQNSAQGSLTVDGQTATIKYAYADEYDGDITVVLADSPLAKQSIPDNVYNLGAKGEFRGFVFSVSRAMKKLQKDGLYKLINAIHYYPLWNQLGSVGDGVLTVSRFDTDTLVGRIATPSDNELVGHKFSYDVSFSVDLKK